MSSGNGARVAFITEAGDDVALAIGRALGRAGWRVAAADEQTARAVRAATEWIHDGVDAMAVTLNPDDPYSWSFAIRETLNRWDRLDALICHPGASRSGLAVSALVESGVRAAWPMLLREGGAIAILVPGAGPQELNDDAPLADLVRRTAEKGAAIGIVCRLVAAGSALFEDIADSVIFALDRDEAQDDRGESQSQ